MNTSTRRQASAFTLIEFMVVVAVLAITLTLAAGPFRDYILMQRLRSVQAQVVTDMAYARSEAISRGTFVQMRVQSGTANTCYIIYARSDSSEDSPCDCTAAAGARCGLDKSEVRTVILPSSESISVVPLATVAPVMLTVDPRTGGTAIISGAESLTVTTFRMETQIDSRRRFRTSMSPQGRVQVCSPDVGAVGGTAC